MYVYWEKLNPTGRGEDAITYFVFSSSGKNNGIDWKSDGTLLKTLSNLFKMVPGDQRMYDENSKIWTFFGYSGDKVKATLESFKIGMGTTINLIIKQINHLEQRVEKNDLNSLDEDFLGIKKEGQKFTHEDFFYSPSAPSAPLSPAILQERIAKLLNIPATELAAANNSALKNYKRKAALLYHPDRNNGDGSKMSEFNMLWEMYTAK